MKTATEYLEDNCSKSEFGLRIYKNSELEKAIQQAQLDTLKAMEEKCMGQINANYARIQFDAITALGITDCANTIRAKIEGGISTYCTCGNPSKEGNIQMVNDEDLHYYCCDCGKQVIEGGGK